MLYIYILLIDICIYVYIYILSCTKNAHHVFQTFLFLETLNYEKRSKNVDHIPQQKCQKHVLDVFFTISCIPDPKHTNTKSKNVTCTSK